MVLCLDNEYNRISKLYDSMESLWILTVHDWIKPALQHFGPNFLWTTGLCFRLTPAKLSLADYFLGPFNIFGIDLLLLKDTSLQLRLWHFLFFWRCRSSILTVRFHSVYFFDNSENCFFFIVPMDSSKQDILFVYNIFPSPTGS